MKIQDLVFIVILNERVKGEVKCKLQEKESLEGALEPKITMHEKIMVDINI